MKKKKKTLTNYNESNQGFFKQFLPPVNGVKKLN